MTGLADLERDVIGNIADAVEAGLAARGLLDAATDRRLHHEKARDLWGLAAADVVANVAHHEADPDGGDRSLIERFADPLGFQVFDAFGGYDVRRARVAERDGDLPLALARWALLGGKNADARRERGEALDRLARRLFDVRDPYARRAALEATIERLRTSESSPEALGNALRVVEDALASLGDPNTSPSEALRLLLFRVRSFSRDQAHRRADFPEARRLDKVQQEARAAVAASPEGFPLVLDDDVRAVNMRTQSLELLDALQTAKDYAAFVAHYREVWELLDQGDPAAFSHSRVHLRATQALARHLAFAAPLQEDSERDAQLTEADALLSDVPEPDADGDQARLRNDRVLVALRRSDPASALAIVQAIEGPADAYDHYYACRAAAGAMLVAPDIHRETAERILHNATAAEDLFSKPSNPLQFAWRERALLAFLLGDKREAQVAIQEAAVRTGSMGDAPIKRWSQLVLAVYKDAFDGKSSNVAKYVRVGADEVGHQALVDRTIALSGSDGGNALSAIRFCSPY